MATTDLKYIIITADVKPNVLNRLLLSLRGWEFGPDAQWDNCTIVRAMEDYSTGSFAIEQLPTREVPKTDFLGKSVQEVEDLMLTQDSGKPNYVGHYFLLDQKGIEEETIIFADRALGDAEDIDEDDASFYKDHYNKVRLPWMEAHIVWCNLAVQYIGFESFTEEDTAPEDGWCTYKRIEGPEESIESCTKKRNAVLRDMASRNLEKRVIITADVDLKIINKLLLSLRDWEFGDEPSWDDSTIVWKTTDLVTGSFFVDRPPVRSIPTDYLDFHGKSVQEVESLVSGEDGDKPYLDLFLILDEEGVRDETIIIVERAADDGEGEESSSSKRCKVRVPWIQAHTMWINLKIANMDFEDFCEDFWDDDDEAGHKEWFSYQSVNEDDYYKPYVEKRDTVLRELAKLDLA